VSGPFRMHKSRKYVHPEPSASDPERKLPSNFDCLEATLSGRFHTGSCDIADDSTAYGQWLGGPTQLKRDTSRVCAGRPELRPGMQTNTANALIRPQRGSGGSDASVAKRNIVVEWKSCPGFNSVVGKFGLLGLSGKCCVSSVKASVWR